MRKSVKNLIVGICATAIVVAIALLTTFQERQLLPEALHRIDILKTGRECQNSKRILYETVDFACGRCCFLKVSVVNGFSHKIIRRS